MAQLTIYAKPPHLHRYRPLGDAVLRELHALRNGYIFCPNFSTMNDPMEGTYRLSRRLSSNAGAAKSPARVQAALEAMGIASLSEVYDHETMWAHYADKFKGMCVHYRIRRPKADGPFSTMKCRQFVFNLSPLPCPYRLHHRSMWCLSGIPSRYR